MVDSEQADASAQAYRALLEQSLLGIAVAGADPLRFLYVNQTLCTFLGRTADDLLSLGGERLAELIHEDDREELFARFYRRLEGEAGSRSWTFRARAADGSVRWLEVASSRILWQGRPAVQGAFVDVTDRVEAEEARAREADWTRRLLDTTLDGFILADGFGTILDVNPAYCALTLYAPEELVGTDIREREAALSPAQVDDRIAEMMVAGGGRFTTQHRARDGRVLDLDVSITVIRRSGGPVVAAFVRDVSAERDARLALEEREARYRAIFEDSPVSLWDEDYSAVKARFQELRAAGVTDLQDHLVAHAEELATLASLVRVREVNRATLKLFGAHRSDELTENIAATFTPRAFDVFSQQLTALWEGRTRFHSTATYRSLDGRDIAAEVSVVIPAGADANWTRVLVSLTDITTRQGLEQQLHHAQKMEALGRLAGGVAHDFNNLLTAINGFTELALQDVAPDSPLRSDLQQVRAAGRRGQELTQQILAFSRRQVLNPTVLDVNRVVGMLVPFIKRVIGEDITWLFEPADVPRVEVDRGQLEQVLMNLAVNARDAMPTGGTLRVATAAVDLDEAAAAEIGDARPGRYTRILMRDTGPGLPPEITDRIFEPFFTTKGPGQGTGLGLGTVYGIVRQSGGFVTVDSRPGEGAAFHVHLPAVRRRGRGGASPEARENAAPPRGRGERIVVAEDEEAVRAFVVETLRGLGYQVREARDGTDAKEILLGDAPRPDLVLTDVMMPQVDGIEIARVAESLGIEVLFMSGYVSDPGGADRLPPAEKLLRKPFLPADLARRIRTILDKRPSEG